MSTLPADRFLDRELSWLAFNSRVLELAADENLPLLERLHFLAIFGRNLDAFFMVRVAGLTRRLATGSAVPSACGTPPEEQLARISSEVRRLLLDQGRVLTDLLSALRPAGVNLLGWAELSQDERADLQEVFEKSILPVLSPLAVDPARPFPYISGLSLNLGVLLRRPGSDEEHFARVKLPASVSRFLPVGEGRFVALEEITCAHLDQLFPGMEVMAADCFRVTRNNELAVDLGVDEEGENLLEALERELLSRRAGPPVRLEVPDTMSPELRELLTRQLTIDDTAVYRSRGPLAVVELAEIVAVDRDDLKYPPFVPGPHPRLASAATGTPSDFFAALRAGDLLVHHPYDSFATTVQAFVVSAAADPKVQAIKMTLYRTSGNSPIMDALIDAAEAGKQVLVLIELQARFQEQANIEWARALEEAGCHVVYGLVGLKTHAKLCLVIRQESDGLRRYAHLGTGNYHPRTARTYEDIGLLTADPVIGSDLGHLFNRLSGYSLHQDYSRLLVAPTGLRSGLIERIERVAAAARAGRQARITIKVASLVDEAVIDALYAASAVGVPIDLVVRGMCALRPGVPGLSESIRVRSILGRFLEHSRIFRFDYDGEDPAAQEVLIGSADIMHRNLDRRVEVLVQICDPAARAELAEVLALAMENDVSAWHLGPDGIWTRMPGEDYQMLLLSRMKGRAVRHG
ncbi:MAG: RNA degradosome polyphosphate kinase [Frankiaceae bacterium]